MVAAEYIASVSDMSSAIRAGAETENCLGTKGSLDFSGADLEGVHGSVGRSDVAWGF